MGRMSTEEIEIRDILGLDDRTPDTVEAVRAVIAERDTLRAECGYDWKAMCEAAERRTTEAESRLAMAIIGKSCADQWLLNAEIRADQWQAKAKALTETLLAVEAKLSAADRVPAARIEWTVGADRSDLDVVAGTYRFNLASIEQIGRVQARIFGFGPYLVFSDSACTSRFETLLLDDSTYMFEANACTYNPNL